MSENKNSFLVFINDLTSWTHYFPTIYHSIYRFPIKKSINNVWERIVNHQTVTFCIERHSNTEVNIYQKLEKQGKWPFKRGNKLSK